MRVLPKRVLGKQVLNRGFTLIELLVVIAAIGILISIAVVSFNLISDDRGLQKQALQLSSLIELASDEAQMQGRDFGLELLQRGFRFVEYDSYLEVWDAVAGDDLLRQRELAQDMELELILEERRVLLQDQAADTQQDGESKRDLNADYLPHILIMASGDITPFQLLLIRQTDQLTVSLELQVGGELEISNNDQQL